MAKLNISSKRLQIDKANTTVVIMASIAAFLLTFTIFAGRALLSQRSFQSRVIREKTGALNQLQANVNATTKLVESYKTFVGQPTNVISGSATGKNDLDGDNAKIILDALPSKYDFPALATSLEKMFKSDKYTLDSITGADDEIAQAESTSAELVEMPFEVKLSGTYAGINTAISTMERSIRPIHVLNLKYTGTDNKLSVTINAKSFYQPEKSLKITTKDVK